jgi:hypothetical protein
MENKTHWRSIDKSDHLGVADLEEMIEEKKSLIFTIKEVKIEKGVRVAGKKGDFRIAYFKESIKPLVVNATNGKVIKSFCNNSSFVEDWKNVVVELYIESNVKSVDGGTTDGVLIRKIQPTTKQKPVFTEANFEKAKTAGATIEAIKGIYQISSEVEQKYNEYVATK